MSNNRTDFVHLHVHTDLSLLQGAAKIKPLSEKISEFGMSSCAITDYANMFGAVSFYNTMKAKEIKPILGIEAYLSLEDGVPSEGVVKEGERPFYNFVLLAKDFEGYLNLAYMASKAYTDHYSGRPVIPFDLLEEKSSNLIALSGGNDGPVSHFIRAGQTEKAEANIGLLKRVFGDTDLYLEVSDHGLEHESNTNQVLRELSNSTSTPLVATNNVHYLEREDARAHEILMCIGDGKTVHDVSRRQMGSDEFYFKSPDEMWDRLGDDFADALNASVEIAERCNVEIKMKDNLQLPVYPIPEDSGCTTIDEYFRKVIYDGFEERKQEVLNEWEEKGMLKYPMSVYEERIEEEIGIINDMGFPGYFLIVWDFMHYAREADIPVGPGRGSAAGSLVAYCMRITDIDPIQYDLLFERFLNPERISMPDIDIDFCIRGRGQVIEHVSRLYGAESVCQIITFGTMASKAAIKDVGRALNLPFAEVEKVAKMIPPPVRGRNVSISQALEQVPELNEAVKQDPNVAELVDLALRVEGCSRHTSIHAAGVVIAPKPLYDLVPIAVSSRTDDITSQYPMNDLEKVGLLKMDFLALTTLTIISDCLKHLKRRTGKTVDWGAVSLEDPETMALFSEGRTEAIFQFESGGMQEICRRLKPKELEDLAALNALYRPGPLDGGMVDDFIARHRGEKKVRYLVPEMKEILKNTYGILVYQEQIMQLAQKLAGYSLGEADMMRRAMGKKKRKEMAVHEEKFIGGAIDKGIPKKKAEEIYNLMAQFADYGFNRSHSVAYAYVAFQTGYLKAHFPSDFYAAVLSSEADDSAKIYKYTTEMKLAGVELQPPDVNESDAGFTPSDDSVRFGLTAIKGLGTSSVEAIINARSDGGKFTSIFDFASRVEQKALNRRSLESLVNAGAFDSLSSNGDLRKWRATLANAIPDVLKFGQRVWKDKEMGQSALFGGDTAGGVSDEHSLADAEPYTRMEMSRLEKESVGLYLSNHPLDSFEKEIERLYVLPIGHHSEVEPGAHIKAVGVVTSAQVRHSRKGNRFCIFRLEDKSAGAKCLLWAEPFAKYGSLVSEDALLFVKAKVESNEGQDITLIVEEITSLNELSFKNAHRLILDLQKSDLIDKDKLGKLLSSLGSTKGNCSVVFRVPMVAENEYLVEIDAPPLRVAGSTQLNNELLDLGLDPIWENPA